MKLDLLMQHTNPNKMGAYVGIKRNGVDLWERNQRSNFDPKNLEKAKKIWEEISPVVKESDQFEYWEDNYDWVNAGFIRSGTKGLKNVLLAMCESAYCELEDNSQWEEFFNLLN